MLYIFQVLDYVQYYLDLKAANKEISSKSDLSDGHTIIREKADVYTKNQRYNEGNSLSRLAVYSHQIRMLNISS